MMKQKYLLFGILGIAVIVIIFMSVYIQEKGNIQSILTQPNQTELSDQEKCEKSGGKWVKICPHCLGCPCEYICDCSISKNDSIKYINGVKVTTWEYTYMLENNGVCEKCSTDNDCFKKLQFEKPFCKVGNTKVCEELLFECVNGICKRSHKFFAPKNKTSYRCQGEKCIPCDDECVNK